MAKTLYYLNNMGNKEGLISIIFLHPNNWGTVKV